MFRDVREAKVTTNHYHWPFCGKSWRGNCLICLIINWLPPEDSNLHMLIQRQLAYDSPEFPGVDWCSGKLLS